MSRRKQKRPQQLVNADPGGTRLASQGERDLLASCNRELGGATPQRNINKAIHCWLSGIHSHVYDTEYLGTRLIAGLSTVI